MVQTRRLVCYLLYSAKISDIDLRNHTGSHKINNAIGQVRKYSTAAAGSLTSF